MSKDAIVAFESAIDLIAHRLEKAKLCEKDRKVVMEVLKDLRADITKKKLERLELEIAFGM